MFDSNSFTQDMLSNPTKMMKVVIDAMQAADTTGATLINDPNNGFVMQLSSTLAVQAGLAEKIDNVAAFLYPRRSRNAKQLFPHLSEFDYVKLMAAPAALPFVFEMSAQWIRENSVYYDTNYNRLVIPDTSTIVMGGITYSMYYPIEILVNRNTGAITAYYDGSFTNNLKELSSNMLLDVQNYTRDGIERFLINFTMYQFAKAAIPDIVVASEQGFTRSFTYEDQFYAARIYTKNTSGNWVELAYSLSELYYDYTKPTAILNLLPDSSQLVVSIPQVYFDTSQVSRTIRVELYTTKGAVNYSVGMADVQGLEAHFDTSSSVFAGPFDKMPTWSIYPTTIEVVGGANAMSYAEIRDAIVNQKLSDRVAVTTQQIEQAASRAGFTSLTRVKDDLTERIYFASNVLADANDMVIPTFTGNILLKDEALTGNPSSIISFTDGYYTLLPTTTFTMGPNGRVCVPMNDGQVATMAAMTDDQLIAELNTGKYVRQSFHITLKTDPKSPQVSIYNLLSPAWLNTKFLAENAHSAPQMTLTRCEPYHLQHGTGGYQLLLQMTRSSNIETADITNFAVIVSCVTHSGDYAYLPATFSQTNANGLDEYVVNLDTSYHLTHSDHLTVRMYDNNDILRSVEISLTQDFSIVAAFKKTFDPTVPVDNNLNGYLPPSLRGSMVAMARQVMTVELGRNLSTQIYCGVNTIWGTDVYKTATSNVYYHTDVPVFQTHETTGVIVTRVNGSNQVEVVRIYHPGDVPAVKEDFDLSVTANVAVPGSGTTTTYPLADTTGVLLGMNVRGTGIPAGSKVVAKTINSVTLDKKITSAIAAKTVLTFTNPAPNLRTTQAQSGTGTTLKVASTQDLLVGQSVFGFDIPVGATIQSIVDATTFTLSVPTTTVVGNNTLLTILNIHAPGVLKTAIGDVETDAAGNAIIVKEAQNEYLIPAILFDGRIFASQDVTDQQVITTIADRLNSYGNQVASIDNGLIERAEVYYKPSRSMGPASFGVGGGRTITLPLTLSFSVTIYVDTAIYNTQTLLDSMEDSVIAIINTQIQEKTISLSKIADVIRDQLGNNAAAVEMGPISGQPGLQLVALSQTDVTPSIEYILEKQNDGHIHRVPNIQVTFIPKPDTSKITPSRSL